jgi:hypothetical protein
VSLRLRGKKYCLFFFTTERTENSFASPCFFLCVLCGKIVVKKLATKTRRHKAAQRKPLVHLSVFASSWQKNAYHSMKQQAPQ